MYIYADAISKKVCYEKSDKKTLGERGASWPGGRLPLFFIKNPILKLEL